MIVAAVLAYVASPYVSIGRLYLALDGADESALAARVNWPALRRGFS